MNAPVQRRIEALEARNPQARRWVWRREGETTEQAKLRGGCSPDDVVTVFSWVNSKRGTGATA